MKNDIEQGKENYTKLEMEIIAFVEEDIITKSGDDEDLGTWVS